MVSRERRMKRQRRREMEARDEERWRGSNEVVSSRYEFKKE